MGNSNTKALLFIAFVVYNIGFSSCQEPINDSLKYGLNPEKINIAYYLQIEGSKENILAGYVPRYGINLKDEHNKYVPLNISWSDYGGEPAYRVGFESNNVNEGDYLVTDVWITGVGDVNWSKLFLRIPPQLVDGQVDAVVQDHYLTIINDTENKTFDVEQIPLIYLTQFNTTEIGFSIPLINFYPYHPAGTQTNSVSFVNYGSAPIAENSTLITYPKNWSYKMPKEDTSKKYYIYKIIFKINKKAPPGDYSIIFDLFYKWGGKWYTDSQSLPLHKNYLYENEDLQILVIILIILGFICEFIKLIGWNRIKSFFLPFQRYFSKCLKLD